MKFIKNNNGVALITALMLTLICLVIVMCVLYTVTRNIRSSASQKVYRNSIEASYGGAEVVMNELLPKLFDGTGTITSLQTSFAGVGLSFTAGGTPCINDKLTKAPANWANCTNGTILDPKINHDFRFTLSGSSGQNYTVFSKIVDTVPGADYINPGGTPLLGSGVADSGGGTTGVPPQHFVYRIEVSGEKTTNPAERAILSVLYEY